MACVTVCARHAFVDEGCHRVISLYRRLQDWVFFNPHYRTKRMDRNPRYILPDNDKLQIFGDCGDMVTHAVGDYERRGVGTGH